MAVRAVHVRATGRVQGVGYRAFVEREAEQRRLAGWVRNRRDGSVEAVFSGESADVEAVLAACRHGPPAAQVAAMDISNYAGPPVARFTVLPTA